MSGVSLKYDLSGVKTLATKFERLKKLGDDLSPVMADIASMLETSIAERFKNEQSPSGEKWKKPRRGGQALSLSGILSGSITSNHGKNFAETGTNLIYAAIHQYGGTIKPKNGKYLKFSYPGGFALAKSVDIPARPFLGISKEDEISISDIINSHVEGALA